MPEGREAEARRFYCELLGVPETPKPSNLTARGGCWFEKPGLKIHLGIEKPFSPARKAYAAFIVDDLPALVAGLQAPGFEATRDEPLAGFVRRYVSDSFGNRIELMQPTASP